MLIIDDSAVVRRTLTKELEREGDIKIVGAAPDPYVAREMIARLEPDVLTLDIEMPRMDGLTFLRKLMKHHPIPTIVVSSVTPRGCDMGVACLEAGAIEVLCKPDAAYSTGDLSRELRDRIRIASRVDARQHIARIRHRPPRVAATDALLSTTHKIIAIGASTGGTEAIRTVLEPLPRTCPGIIITQHMPEGFTTAFADRLNGLCQIDVKEADDGDAVRPGQALIAPGNRHLQLARDGARYIVRVKDGPRVCGHKPSVEVLFASAARFAGRNAMGIMLTGMGGDGAQGMKAMHDAGAYTIAQDEATCVVYGMPREAVLAGGVDTVAPLHAIAGHVMQYARRAAEAG